MNIFAVKVENGRIAFRSEHQRALFLHQLRKHEGKEITLRVEGKKLTRSAKQNAYYWVYLSLLAEATGNTADGLHAWAKQEFISTAYEEVFGERVPLEKTTTKLSKLEFTEYIMEIEQFTGIPAPDPRPFDLPMTIEEWEEARERQREKYATLQV